MPDILPIHPHLEQRRCELELLVLIDQIQQLRRGGPLTEARLVDGAWELNIELEEKLAAARAAGALK